MKGESKSKWQLLSGDSWVRMALILAILGIIVIMLPWNIIDGKTLPFTNFFFKTKEYGALGDFISGISSPLLGAATIILLVRTYTLQKDELAKTSIALSDQMRILQKQRFEDNFFRLLENHHRIVEAMDLYDEKKGTKVMISVKRDCFRTFYNHMKNEVDKKMVANTAKREKTSIEDINRIYDETQDYYKADLHHYFRFIYHILKFVKNSKEIEEDEKYKYTSILRATLSPYELALIFYNCLHEFGDTHFKPLVEEYSFLKNRHKDLIFIGSQSGKYHDLAFAKSADRPALFEDWKKKQLEGTL